MAKKPAGQAFQEKAEKIAQTAATPTPTKQDIKECPPISDKALPNEVPLHQRLLHDDRTTAPWLQMRALLAQKLLLVYEAMGYIQKKGVNKQQNYRFVSEADFAEKMSEACIKAKLAIIPSFPEATVSYQEVAGQQGNRLLHMATVKGTYKIIDAETGWFETFDMWGASQDYGDKAIYKAITGAQKYAIFKVSLCSTGDDPEDDQALPKEAQTARPATAPAQAQKPAQAAKGNGQEKTPKDTGTGSGAQKPAQTSVPPKETPSQGASEVHPDLQGASLGTITNLEPPKAPQKPGWLMFQRPTHTDPLKIWFWVERLPSGVTLGDLVSFLTNKVEITLHWVPDSTNRYATLKGLELPDMPDMNDPNYLDQAADQFGR